MKRHKKHEGGLKAHVRKFAKAKGKHSKKGGKKHGGKR